MYQVAYFLTRNASMFPNKCAVAYKGQALTYLELNQAANRAANGLMALGLKKGDLPRTIRFAWLYPCLKKLLRQARPPSPERRKQTNE